MKSQVKKKCSVWMMIFLFHVLISTHRHTYTRARFNSVDLTQFNFFYSFRFLFIIMFLTATQVRVSVGQGAVFVLFSRFFIHIFRIWRNWSWYVNIFIFDSIATGSLTSNRFRIIGIMYWRIYLKWTNKR